MNGGGGGASAAGAADGGRERRSTDLGGGGGCSGQKGKLPSKVRALDGEEESPGARMESEMQRLRIGAAAPSMTPCPESNQCVREGCKMFCREAC